MDWNGEMCPKWTHQEAGPTANPNYHTDWGNNIYILRGHHIPEKTSKWAPQFSLFARNNPSNSHSEIIDFDYIQLAWQVIWSEAMVMPANVYHCWTNQLQATFWCAPCLSPVLRLAPCCDGSPIWLGGSGIHPEGHLSFTIAYPCIYSSWYTEPRCSRVRLTWCQICLIFWFVRYLVAYVPTNILKPCIYQMTCLISSIYNIYIFIYRYIMLYLEIVMSWLLFSGLTDEVTLPQIYIPACTWKGQITQLYTYQLVRDFNHEHEQ